LYLHCESYRVLLYMFLMILFSWVYCFIHCTMVSILKHPSSMWLYQGFNCVLWERVVYHLLLIELIRNTLNQFIQVSDFRWIHSLLLESIHIWIDSFHFESSHQNSLTYTESNQQKVESYQSSSWAHMNRFTCALNRFILHAFLGFLLLYESFHSFSESIHYVVFMRKFSLTSPHYI